MGRHFKVTNHCFEKENVEICLREKKNRFHQLSVFRVFKKI